VVRWWGNSSRRGWEVIWGGWEDGKITRRSVHGGRTRAGKHADDGAVWGQGGPFRVWGAPG
jgi:hypothetical protein